MYDLIKKIYYPRIAEPVVECIARRLSAEDAHTELRRIYTEYEARGQLEVFGDKDCLGISVNEGKKLVVFSLRLSQARNRQEAA